MCTRPLVLFSFVFLSLIALSHSQLTTLLKCADGSTPVNCLMDPCKTASCPAYPNANCSADYCHGGCDVIFRVEGRVVDCKGTCPDGTQPNNCLIDPCGQAKCPNHPNANCTANYCSGGCDAIFVENGHVVTDCTTILEDSCVGKCTTKPDAAPCADATQQPRFAYCAASASTSVAGCAWKSECTGECCINQIGFNCSAISRINSDWCPDGSTCCLTSDALGEGAHSFSCCPRGSVCAKNPVATRGGGYYCAPADDPCKGVACLNNQQCYVEKGQPVCKDPPVVTNPCAVVLCIANSVCKVDSLGKPICVPIEVTTDPCATVRCTADTYCVAQDGKASCVPISGKPGECPKVDAGSVGICISECGSDLQCAGTKKCCKNACGGTSCTEPITGTVKPGTCPEVKPGVIDICLAGCTSDSDCKDNLKCCGAACNKQCVRPVENTCTKCPDDALLAVKLAAPVKCPDGTTGGYYCNMDTCSWEYKACQCTCDLTTFAADVATASIDSSTISICLAAVAQYDSTTKTAAASATTTSSSTSVAADYLAKCYGSGTCELVGDKCVSSWGCGSCLPVTPTPKCVRAGCQNEKCVAFGAAITKECAQPSHALDCLDQAICDVDASGNCGWQYTEEYKKCIANPDVDSTICSTRDPCKCSQDDSCFWCLSRYRTLDLNTVSVGRCLPVSLQKKCLAPTSLDGFAGNILASVSDCKVASGNFETLIETKDPVSVDVKLSQYISEKSELSGIKVRIESILTPEKLSSSTDGGVARTLVVIDPKPTETQRPILCKLITDSLLSASTSRTGATLSTKVYSGDNCKLSEVSTGTEASGSVKRQAPAGSGTYLHEAQATEAIQGSTASFIPRDFVMSMVFLVVGLFFAL